MHQPSCRPGAARRQRCVHRAARCRHPPAALVVGDVGGAVGCRARRSRQWLSLARPDKAVARHRPRFRDRPCHRRIAAAAPDQAGLGRFPRVHSQRSRCARSAEHDRACLDRGFADRRSRGQIRTEGADPPGHPAAQPARRQFSRRLALCAPAIPADPPLPPGIVVLRCLRRHHGPGGSNCPTVECARLGARLADDPPSRRSGLDRDRDSGVDRQGTRRSRRDRLPLGAASSRLDHSARPDVSCLGDLGRCRHVAGRVAACPLRRRQDRARLSTSLADLIPTIRFRRGFRCTSANRRQAAESSGKPARQRHREPGAGGPVAPEWRCTAQLRSDRRRRRHKCGDRR